MKNRILSEKQKRFIQHLPEHVRGSFYLAGGTALSAFYLEHRLSQDLDFFTDSEAKMPPIEYLTTLIHRVPGVAEIQYERLFDRRIFAVIFSDSEMLKVEFTSYPFRSIQKRKEIGGLTVDSLLNILTGKVFAITDRFDPKDFIDLFFASELRSYGGTLRDLILQTEKRFGITGMNYFIPERLLMSKRIRNENLPVMIKEIDLEKMRRFFMQQSDILLKSRISKND